VQVMAAILMDCTALELVAVPEEAPVPTDLQTNVCVEHCKEASAPELPCRFSDEPPGADGAIGEFDGMCDCGFNSRSTSSLRRSSAASFVVVGSPVASREERRHMTLSGCMHVQC
jgi:hypothetical protein